jgi:hypothetical protein
MSASDPKETPVVRTFRSEPADHDGVARAAFNAAVHHSRSSIMVLAVASSSVQRFHNFRIF